MIKIVSVEAETIHHPDNPPPSWLGESVIANPMSIYPEYYARRSSWTAPLGEIWVTLTTDEGIVGSGITVGGVPAITIIREHFARFLIGQDAFDIERLWDQMFRASLPYGRRGLVIHAISAVDMALWDIVGQVENLPVYKLLGGSTKARIPVYQTTNDPHDWEDPAFFGVKLAMPYGPIDGVEGILGNVKLIKACRDVIGPHREIMLDCYMAWDVGFTLRMIDAVEPLGVRWVEEPLPPDDYHGYERLGKYSTPVAIASGEHEHTRWGFRDLIETGGVSVVQPDLAWVGGISETRKICAMASAYGLTVVPHAGGLSAAGLHLIKSQVNAPYAEWVRTWDRSKGRPVPVIVGVPDPEDGFINPSDAPGLGISYRGANRNRGNGGE